eukprot:2344096-Pyramimonas_sp.AAC.1
MGVARTRTVWAGGAAPAGVAGAALPLGGLPWSIAGATMAGGSGSPKTAFFKMTPRPFSPPQKSPKMAPIWHRKSPNRGPRAPQSDPKRTPREPQAQDGNLREPLSYNNTSTRLGIAVGGAGGDTRSVTI